jgi:hypothetical protein
VDGTATGRTITELVCSYISDQGTVETAESGRLNILGAHARDIISIIPSGFCWFLLVLIIGANLISGGRRAKESFERDTAHIFPSTGRTTRR